MSSKLNFIANHKQFQLNINEMKSNIKSILVLFLFTIFCSTAVNAQLYTTYAKEMESDTAIIVVTGLKITTDTKGHPVEDLSVGMEATVKLTDQQGKVVEKKTTIFSQKFYNGDRYYTADFPIKIDSLYTISITFSDGKVIKVSDYKIDNAWKRHHYFHGTTGAKSPASLLRKEEDSKTGFACYIYSLFPLKNYIEKGGTQIK
jgi:hypothetical protein